MDKSVHLKFIIDYLLLENGETTIGAIYSFEEYRALVSMRAPRPIDKDYLDVEKEYLSIILAEKGVVTISELKPIYANIYLWRGDITTLSVDAIVNPSSSGLRGRFTTGLDSLDNMINTHAGIPLRLECEKKMQRDGGSEKCGSASITAGYCLPAKNVIHTVGPMIIDQVDDADIEDLKNCYRNCLKLAIEEGLTSIAFSCIATGNYKFPNDLAAEIAINTVTEYLNNNENNGIKVIFNVYKELDYECYNTRFTS